MLFFLELRTILTAHALVMLRISIEEIANKVFAKKNWQTTKFEMGVIKLYEPPVNKSIRFGQTTRILSTLQSFLPSRLKCPSIILSCSLLGLCLRFLQSYLAFTNFTSLAYLFGYVLLYNVFS